MQSNRRVLFLCTGNSCRSQMAEGFARVLAPGWEVFSAGLEPSRVNPHAIEAMDEIGIDLRAQRSKGLEAVPVAELDTVITLCGDAEERCPFLPGHHIRIHWPLPDPARATGNPEQVAQVFRTVRDDIQWRVRDLAGGRRGTRPGEE